MPGKSITKEQVKLYMNYKSLETLSQSACAAKSGFSTRSARTIDQGKHHTQGIKKVRAYKTRKSGIDTIWESTLEPMLSENPDLQPTSLFIHLERTFQDTNGQPIYDKSCLRTLQRRVAAWKATHGPDQDIIIPQIHIPGNMALSDFTNMNEVGVTISGEPFDHLLYHFRLVYSKWSYGKVILTGESFQALSEGMQEALQALGGASLEHRTDSLSAAFKNLNPEAKLDLTTQYESLCKQYNMIPTRNNKGVSHENGSVESSHGHLKNRIKQELILRGSNDFASLDEYELWVQQIIANSNRRNSKNFTIEQKALQPLPNHMSMDYELLSVKASKLSMVIIRNMTYSVPSRLAGHVLTVHAYQKHLEFYLGTSRVLKLQRVYSKAASSRYVIAYKHVIHAFVRKPGAFRFCKYRNELLPNDTYRKIWEHLDSCYPKSTSPKMMLRLLKLACDHDCEATLGESVLSIISAGGSIDISKIESHFNKDNPQLPAPPANQHSISKYDSLIPGERYNAA